MADITHGTWIEDGKAVDAVYQNGVKVYGRNLIKGGTHKTILASDNPNSYQVIYTGLIPNQTYTLSMIGNLTGSSDNLVTVNLYGDNTSAPQLDTYNMVADGTTSKCQFTVPSNGLQLIIYAGKQFSTAGIGLDVKQIKLEIGDQTAFSLAPEDVLN